MQGSGTDPDPGPAPPPSLTLPPLSELDKVIRPDSGPDHRYSHNMTLMGSQSRSQSQLSDPHLHSSMLQRPHYSGSSSSGSMVNGLPPQHPQQLQLLQQHQHNHYQFQSPSVDSRPPYAHDQHSRHSSSVGSLPDLYMSSPSAPSTTTTSSLSRADSLSSMEYLQGAHPGHSRRHLSSAGDVSSTTTGSTTGSSYGPSRSSLSGSGRGSASGSVMSGGSRSLHHHHYHSSMGLGRANLTAAIHHQQQQLQLQQQQQHARTTASSTSSSSAHAPVNMQRSTAAGGKDSNANGHGNGTGNGKSTGSSAGSEQGRNTTKRAAQNRAAQRAFRQRKDLYVRELERKAELLQEAEGQILQLAAKNHALELTLAQHQQHRQQQQSSPSSSGSPQPLPHDPNHHPSPTRATVAVAEADHRPVMTRDTNEFDEFEYDRFPRSGRDHHHPYHSSRQEPPLSPPRLALNRHESTPEIRSAYTRGRESAYDTDAYSTHRSSHRQQQLPLERRGSNNSADSGDDHYGPATGRSDPGPEYHGGARDGSMDYGPPAATPHFSSVGSQLLSTQSQERPSLYRISTEGGRLGPLESPSHNGANPLSARSWHEETHKLRSSPQTLFSPLGGMIRSPAGGMVGDTEYMVEDRLPEGRPPAAAALYEGIKKRQSEGSFNWTGPRSSARSSHHPALSKQSSWSAFPTSSPPSSSKPANNGGSGPSAHLPPLNNHFREHPGDTEMQETPPPQQQQVRHDSHPPFPLQHRGSASSLSGGLDTERRMSGSEAGSMGLSRMAMSDSPDLSSSDSSRFTSSAMSMRYPSQQQQQLQAQHPQGRSSYPQTPENEYPPTLHSNGSPGQFRKRPDDHSSEMDAVYEHYPQHHLHQQHHRGLAVHEAMETAMRSP